MDPVIHKLVEMWLQDMNQFSQPWMYYWLFIPAIVYFCIYVIKWLVISFPLWGPIFVVCQIIKEGNCNSDCQYCLKNNEENADEE